MAKRRAVKPKVVNGVHVNFEECKQAFRAEALELCERKQCFHLPWGKAYTNKRADGIQWKLWLLNFPWVMVGGAFQHYFRFISLAGCSARAWTHKSDFDRRDY